MDAWEEEDEEGASPPPTPVSPAPAKRTSLPATTPAGKESDDVDMDDLADLSLRIKSLEKRHSVLMGDVEEKTDGSRANTSKIQQNYGLVERLDLGEKEDFANLTLEEKLHRAEKEKVQVLSALTLLVGEDRLKNVLKTVRKTSPRLTLSPSGSPQTMDWRERMARDKQIQSDRLRRKINGDTDCHARHPKRWGQSEAVTVKKQNAKAKQKAQRSPSARNSPSKSATQRQYSEDMLSVGLYDALQRSKDAQAYSTERIERIKEWAAGLVHLTGESPAKLVEILEQVESKGSGTVTLRSPRQLSPRHQTHQRASSPKYRSRIDEYHHAQQYEHQRETAGRLAAGRRTGKPKPAVRKKATKGSPKRKNNAFGPDIFFQPPRSMPAPPLSTPNDKILAMLRAAIESRRTLYGHTIDDTRSLFQSLDQHGSGRIDAEDVQYGLRRLGIEITPLQAEDLVLSMSVHGDGCVNYVEFANKLHERDGIVLPSDLGSPGGKMPMRPFPKGGGQGASPIIKEKMRPQMIGGAPQVMETRFTPHNANRARAGNAADKRSPSMLKVEDDDGLELRCTATDASGIKRTELCLDLSMLGSNRPMTGSISIGFPKVEESIMNKADRKIMAQHLDLLSRLFTDSSETPSMKWLSREKMTFLGEEAISYLVRSLRYVETGDQAIVVLTSLLANELLVCVEEAQAPNKKDDQPAAENKAVSAAADPHRPPAPPKTKQQELENKKKGLKFTGDAIYACTNFTWKELGSVDVTRAPSYCPKKSIAVQFRGDEYLPMYADGTVVAINVKIVGKNTDAPSSPRDELRSPGSPQTDEHDTWNNDIHVTARVALSDILRIKFPADDTKSGTIFVGPTRRRLIGVHAKAPIGAGVNMPLENDSDQGVSTASFNFSKPNREFHVYESMRPPELPSIAIPSQIIDLYINRIRELLRLYQGEADPSALEQQRELLGNYLAFEAQLMPSIKNQKVDKSVQLLADVSRQFEATNIHVYNLATAEVKEHNGKTEVHTSSYETVTMGLPAAHSVGFHQGGLSRLQETYLKLRRKAVDGYIQPSEERFMERLGLQIDIRKDICLAQSLSGLTASFIGACREHGFRPLTKKGLSTDDVEEISTANQEHLAWWTQMFKTGFLAHFECIVGVDDEEGMLEDAIVGIRLLDRVVFKLSQTKLEGKCADLTGPDGTCVSIKRVQVITAGRSDANYQGGVGKIEVEVYLGPDFLYDSLPVALQEGRYIPTRPVMMCQALDTTVPVFREHDLANEEGLEKLIYYCSLRRRAMGNSAVDAEVDELLNSLEECRRKQPGLRDVSDIYTWLLVSERITRLVGGSRVTCCANGKDLSVMAATLEMAVLLRDNHRLNEVENIANVLRASGVQLTNLRQNTFASLYKVPRTNLPRLYRPPSHVMSSTSKPRLVGGSVRTHHRK